MPAPQGQAPSLLWCRLPVGRLESLRLASGGFRDSTRPRQESWYDGNLASTYRRRIRRSFLPEPGSPFSDCES
jgi:hypothetical protein